MNAVDPALLQEAEQFAAEVAEVPIGNVIEFLIEDLDVPPKEGWRDVIENGRVRWFARQLGAAVRSDQHTAVETLEALGYTIQPP